MRTIRFVVVFAVVGALLAAASLDQADRTPEGFPAPVESAVAVISAGGATWFCPGGSGSTGPARVGIELANAGTTDAAAVLTAMGSETETDIIESRVSVRSGSRTVVSLQTLIPDDPWAGAVVEVSGSGVVVSQIFDGPTGTDRAVCLSRTADSWVVPAGATRVESDGERMVILLLNPFPDDAVVEVAFDADVGLDSLSGVVAPAHRVTAIDVTNEVTVASNVSAIIDVLSGRLAVQRIQTYDSELARGLSVDTATPIGSPVWYLPTVRRADGRTDVLSVTNPSLDEIAQVDIEIISEAEVPLDPIELTVHPRRTIRVSIPDESRLVDLESFTLVARSLSATPVAVSLDSIVAPGGENVAGTAAGSGADIASTSWMLPIGATDAGSGELVVVNPSVVAVARVSFRVIDTEGRRDISTVELGPSRRVSIPTVEFGGTQAVVEVVSTSPVVVGSESAGLTSRSMSIGVRTGPPTMFLDLR